MYRIRRESGEEVTLGSIDEFGAAVAAGIVTAKAEIFHARAEKWLPIASHPHFKMAHDRVTASAAPKHRREDPRHVIRAADQRAAVTASGQRPVAPQLRVMRPDAAAPVAPVDSAVSQKPAPRWNSAQRQAVRAVAPKPSAPPAPATDLRLVLADTLLSAAATAPALPESSSSCCPRSRHRRSLNPSLPHPWPSRSPDRRPSEPARTRWWRPPSSALPPTLNWYRTKRSPRRPAMMSRSSIPTAPCRSWLIASCRALDIPAPIRDFGPTDVAPEPVIRSASKTPLFIGVGLVAAAAAVIGFFALKLSSAPSGPTSPRNRPPVQSSPDRSGTASTDNHHTGGRDGPADRRLDRPRWRCAGQEAKKPGDNASAGTSDGLEPPPEMIPAAPTLGKIGDAATLPTVDAGVARNDAMARAQALEKARRAIDSSMRSQVGLAVGRARPPGPTARRRWLPVSRRGAPSH